jgi:hypothetical protein
MAYLDKTSGNCSRAISRIPEQKKRPAEGGFDPPSAGLALRTQMLRRT